MTCHEGAFRSSVHLAAKFRRMRRRGWHPCCPSQLRSCCRLQPATTLPRSFHFGRRSASATPRKRPRWPRYE
eukprot:scaffold118774_cov45-Phaeocystis_antarctica.AAC.2